MEEILGLTGNYKFQIENCKSLIWTMIILHTPLMAACKSLKK